jgi:hypothetical protein
VAIRKRVIVAMVAGRRSKGVTGELITIFVVDGARPPERGLSLLISPTVPLAFRHGLLADQWGYCSESGDAKKSREKLLRIH